MTKYTVFYSWQSDLLNATNRGFIEKALENAAKTIRADDSLKVEPVVDRDTQGVPGSPDIGKAILEKIDQAHAFVADVTIINPGAARPSPNPNVLIELGYAMKGLGPDKYLLVMNTAHGSPEQLPFDLRMKRVITYHMPEETTDRSPGRKVLQAKLEEALRGVIAICEAHPAVPAVLSIADQLKSAIENDKPNQSYLARKYMDETTNRIVSLAPDFSGNEERDELLLRAIEGAKPIVLEFCRISELIAAMNAGPAAQGIYKGFGKLLERYNVPVGFSGGFNSTDFDFFKFLGHELVVDLFSPLIRENHWELVAQLLYEEILVSNGGIGHRGSTVPVGYASKSVELLEVRNQRLGRRRLSTHADLLIARYQDSDISQHITAQDFTEADYFLFLRSALQSGDVPNRYYWRPRSAVYLIRAPRFLQQAVQRRHAEKLLRPLNVDNVDMLRKGLTEHAADLTRLYSSRDAFYEHPLMDYDYRSIGSR